MPHQVIVCKVNYFLPQSWRNISNCHLFVTKELTMLIKILWCKDEYDLLLYFIPMYKKKKQNKNVKRNSKNFGETEEERVA